MAAQCRFTSRHSGSRKFGSQWFDDRPPTSCSLGLPQVNPMCSPSWGSSHLNGSTRSLGLSYITPSLRSCSSNASPLSARTLAHNTTQSCIVRNITYRGSSSTSEVGKARHLWYQLVPLRTGIMSIIEETLRAKFLGVAYSAAAPFSRTRGYLHALIPSNSNSQSELYQSFVDCQSGFTAVGRSQKRSAPVNRRDRILSVMMWSSNDEISSSRLVNNPPWRPTTLAWGRMVIMH